MWTCRSGWDRYNTYRWLNTGSGTILSAKKPDDLLPQNFPRPIKLFPFQILFSYHLSRFVSHNGNDRPSAAGMHAWACAWEAHRLDSYSFDRKSIDGTVKKKGPRLIMQGFISSSVRPLSTLLAFLYNVDIKYYHAPMFKWYQLITYSLAVSINAIQIFANNKWYIKGKACLLLNPGECKQYLYCQ